MYETITSVGNRRPKKDEDEEEDEEVGVEVEAEENGQQVNSDEEKASATMFQLWETVRVSQPRPWYSLTITVLSVVLLYLWPFISFYVSGNFQIGTLFCVFGLFSLVRIYMDPHAVLTELGSMTDLQFPDANARYRLLKSLPDYLTRHLSEKWYRQGRPRSLRGGADDDGDTEHDPDLKTKFRLTAIVAEISHNRSVRGWMWTFGVFFFLYLLMGGAALSTDEITPGIRPPIVPVTDFYYAGEPDLSYQSCRITKVRTKYCSR